MMVHRDLLEDDGRGVGEPLNETEYVNPSHQRLREGPAPRPGLIILGMYLLSLEAPASAAKVWRPLRGHGTQYSAGDRWGRAPRHTPGPRRVFKFPRTSERPGNLGREGRHDCQVLHRHV